MYLLYVKFRGRPFVGVLPVCCRAAFRAPVRPRRPPRRRHPRPTVRARLRVVARVCCVSTVLPFVQANRSLALQI